MFNRFSCSSGSRDSSGTSYRSFCIHVRNVIAIVCGLELVLILYLFLYKFDETVGTCRSDKHILLKNPGVDNCASTLLLSFTIFHGICDALSLMSIIVEKNKLVLPLLIVLVLNILVSGLFLLISFITYISTPVPYSRSFVIFVTSQGLFRVYEFLCARRLYWYYKWASDQRSAPQCSLLREEESSFQF
ncbi:unnamed protein product [Bursaphelenchus xylophilus]|uniref:(pine wood nematode) hypothetical protein n=1 Tax=Bursaphelenchus xylophilus TaxID=6326 RepID=A0A1I7RNC9_BURXY|nr:unnamed protein product [Bursaphelenchus xylophilus]CAG9123887.1 unnamed protein product [Bursaphelenchus xylophilus]